MFKYIALYKNKLIEGLIEATNEDEAFRRLREQGLIIIHLEPFKKGKIPTRINSAFIEAFTRDMLQLLKAGLTIEKSLIFIAESQRKYKKNLIKAVEELKKGHSLSQALTLTGLFPKDFLELIKAGEESGKIYETLELLYEFYSTFNRFKKDIISSLTYPIFLLIVMITAIVLLSSYVVPKFKTLFETTGGQIPLITKAVFILSDNIENFIIFFVTFLNFILIFLFLTRKFKRLRKKVEEFIIKLPIIGLKLVSYDLIKTSYSLYILIKGGVPLDKSLEIVKDVVSFQLIRESLIFALKKVREGEPLYKSLPTDIFPDVAIEIIKVGEETGELAGAWYQVYISISENLKDFIRYITSLIEPVIILFMGLIVGFIVFGIIVGVFSLTGYM